MWYHRHNAPVNQHCNLTKRFVGIKDRHLLRLGPSSAIAMADDSRIDQDTSSEAPLRREGIEARIHGLRQTRNPESLEPHDPVSYDEWEWRPDGPRDSISVLDRDRCAVEISRWREHCARLRDGRAEGLVPGDVGSPEGGGRCIRRSVWSESFMGRMLDLAKMKWKFESGACFSCD